MAWELADNVRGPKGDKGDTGSLGSASITAVAPDAPAKVTLTGTAADKHAHFEIPRGQDGKQGVPGTLSSASAESVPADAAAEVIMTGSTEVKHAHFKLPRGLPGLNAVQNDKAFATYLAAVDTETRAAVQAVIDSSFNTIDVQKHGVRPGSSAEEQSIALQQLIDAINGPAQLVFTPSPLGVPYAIDRIINIGDKRVSLRGEGVRIDFGSAGLFKIGSGNARVVMNTSVSGLHFYRASQNRAGITVGSRFVQLDRVRDVTITDNTFWGAEEAVEIVRNANAKFHDNGLIRVINNRFGEVDRTFTGRADAWDTINDCKYIGNIVNVAYKGGAYFPNGIDGIQHIQNVEFSLHFDWSDNATFGVKENSIRLGRCNQVVIALNNFFEAGLEGIRIDDAHTITIVGNNVTWSGQLNLVDAISVSFYNGQGYFGRGTIGLNSIEGWTRRAIGVYGPVGELSGLETNSTQWKTLPASLPSTGWDASVGDISDVPFYQGAIRYGRGALTAAACNRFWIDDTTGNRWMPPAIQASIRDGESDRYANRPNAQHIGSFARFLRQTDVGPVLPGSFSASSSLPIAKLADTLRQTTSYGGKALIVVSRGLNSNDRKAYYEYGIAKTPSDGGEAVKLFSAGPDSATVSGDPSFTFSIDSTSNELVATSMGANTIGSFYFWIHLVGNLDVRS